MSDQRPNQKTLSAQQWQTLISAINSMHGIGTQAPAYRDFVRVHVDAMSPSGMQWGVHRMPMGGGMFSSGRNFLAWHRHFLRLFEQRLQVADASITLPYWDWSVDAEIPAALSDAGLLQSWGVTRQPDMSVLPTAHDVAGLGHRTTFASFQLTLEHLHDSVHAAVGGTMDTSSSPADPIFFLHHANVDRLWAQWQQAHPKAKPKNATETLQPAPMFGVTVASQLDIAALGYAYA